MAQTNTFNTRIQHKHDVEANWLKATTFAPKAGELIIYDVDETHSSPRFKVGDGTTLVTDLPFSSATPEDLGEALLKTGDTMEGILKFTKDVHYGENVPETGEEGQIFFQVVDSLTNMIEDGSIGTEKIADGAISQTFTVLLTVEGWANNSQTVTANGVTATNIVIVSPNPATQSYTGYTENGVRCFSQATNALTFMCEDTPTVAITVNVTVINK